MTISEENNSFFTNSYKYLIVIIINIKYKYLITTININSCIKYSIYDYIRIIGYRNVSSLSQSTIIIIILNNKFLLYYNIVINIMIFYISNVHLRAKV